MPVCARVLSNQSSWGTAMYKPTSIFISTIGLIFLAAGGVLAQENSQVGDVIVIDEIIVTSQKREQALGDIPMSITVLAGEALERQQADNFQDLVALIPGFSIASSRHGATRITLRGINTGGVASTVGVYVDDVPFGSSSGLANGAVLSGDFDTFDLARVEVLRGPQGTLYGASSLGGVLKYVPNRPSTEAFEGRVQVSAESVADGDTGFAATGVINLPVGETFALRASGFTRSDEGYIDSIGNNPIATLTDPAVNVIEGTRVEEGLNSLDTKGGRLAALFQPSDAFSLNLTALAQDIESGSLDQIDADAATLKPLNSRPVQSRYQEAFSDFEYRVYSAELDWDFGAATLQSITGDSSFDQDFQQDAAIASSLAGVPLSALLTLLFDDPKTPEIAPLLSAILPQVTSTDKFTQEFRLVSNNSDKFEWLIGAYYTEEDSLIHQEILAVDAGTDNLAVGFPVLADLDLISTYEELAFFANVTWYLSPRLELSLGARSSDNDQTVRQVSSGPLAGASDFDVKSSENPFTWSFSPRYELSDNSSVYFRAATGFRPGGPNVVPPTAPPDTPRTYDPDSLTSYELGYKTTASNGKFSLDVAAYFLDWDDVQLYVRSNGFGVNANGSTAESKGVEFAASFYPSDGLTLSLNGAYTDAQLTADTDPVLVGGVDGDPLPFVPEWSLGAGADYEWVTGNDATAFVGGNLSYTGDRPAGFGNRDSDGDIRDAESYTTLNLRAGLETGRWTFELYGKNVTDEMGINAIGTDDEAVTGRVELGVIRPRTYGLSVGVKF
jgi:outer membrane receptor protein involved in Fe transport